MTILYHLLVAGLSYYVMYAALQKVRTQNKHRLETHDWSECDKFAEELDNEES